MSEPGLVDSRVVCGRRPRHRVSGRAACRRTRGCATRPIRPRSRRSSSSCVRRGQARTRTGTRGLIAILWRAGLRISEALALTESDLDPKTGSVLVARWTEHRVKLVRAGKGGKRRMVGMDEWGSVGPLFCILAGPTRGRGWSATAARGELRRLAARARVRRRFAPHHYADLCVMPTLVRRPCSLTQTAQVHRHNERRLAWWCWTRIRDPFLLIDGVPRLFGVNSQCDATAKARWVGRVMPTSTQWSAPGFEDT